MDKISPVVLYKLFFSEDYNIIADDYSAEFGEKYEDIEIIEEFMARLAPNSKILDLGGGTGKLTDLFIKRGYQATCYDFSKEMMRKSKELYSDLPYVLDDIINVKNHFDSDSFDGIIAFYSLFHIPKEELNNVFSDINFILKDNGILCFVVQLGNGDDFIDEPYLKEKGKKVLYFNFFSMEMIDRLLRENGFEKLYVAIKQEVGENELGKEGNDKIFVISKKIEKRLNNE